MLVKYEEHLKQTILNHYSGVFAQPTDILTAHRKS